MIYELLHRYNEFIQSYKIERFRQVGMSYELIATVIFNNTNELHIHDYLFLDGKRKYAYHYQDNTGQLIFRYDTASHFKQLSTYPYHKHLPDKVVESNVLTIEKVFAEIAT